MNVVYSLKKSLINGLFLWSWIAQTWDLKVLFSILNRMLTKMYHQLFVDGTKNNLILEVHMLPVFSPLIMRQKK